MSTETAPDWHLTADIVPPERAEVDVMLSDGSTQRLVRIGGLWFVPDRSMYVYFVPRHWKFPTPEDEARAREAEKHLARASALGVPTSR